MMNLIEAKFIMYLVFSFWCLVDSQKVLFICRSLNTKYEILL
jgi:hypothetical protein